MYHIQAQLHTIISAILHEPYVGLGKNWIGYVNVKIKESELGKIRNSVNRQAPH